MALTSVPSQIHTGSYATTTVPSEYIERRFLAPLRKRLLLARFGVMSTLPDASGKKVRWNTFPNPSGADDPATPSNFVLSNPGDDPGVVAALTIAKDEATLAEYGRILDFDKLLIRTSVSGTADQFVEFLGYQAAAVFDSESHIQVLTTTTTVDAGVAMTANATRSAASTLDQADAQPHPLTPGGEYFPGFYSSEAYFDMFGEGNPAYFQIKDENLSGTAVETPLSNAPRAAVVNGVYIQRTNNVRRDTTSTPDNDLNLVLADQSFGVARLDLDVVRPTVRLVMPAENPLAPARNRGYGVWHGYFAAVLIDPVKAVAVLSDVT